MISTVVRCEKFMPNNWWWKCCLSALNIGCPFKVLRIIANTVSNIGNPKIIIGTNSEVSAVPLKPNNDITAIIKPINWVQSPANIVAG